MEMRGFIVEDEKLEQLSAYRRELMEWNKIMNLTSLTEDSDIIDKHFIDSLLLFRYEKLKDNMRIADVGTGAGFPGIPIKICKSDVQLLLLESIAKKARFLSHIVGILALEGVSIANQRAEVLGQMPEHRESYDIAVARCVAPLRTLAEYCLPLVQIGGKFIAYKGQDIEMELKEAESAIAELGGKLVAVHRDESYPDRRALVFIEKQKRTPKQYPRRVGLPAKRPL